jgi:SAM-dependent methyltransferase
MTNGVSTTPEPDMGAAYGQAAESWSRGAAIVYGPLADALLDLVVPDHWTGRAVLDLGAGTGVVSDRLRDRGARPVALDLSEDMLRLDRHRRPPALVADVGALPLATAALGGVVASFVLNHVGDPIGVLREMARVSRPGSLVATSVFSSRSSHEPRDRVDRVATRWGWTAPDWYAEVTTATAPLLASAGLSMAASFDARNPIFSASSPIRSRSVIVLITATISRKSPAVGARVARMRLHSSSIFTSSLLTL